MKRLLFTLALAGLAGVFSGCRHTAGNCDCSPPGGCGCHHVYHGPGPMPCSNCGPTAAPHGAPVPVSTEQAPNTIPSSLPGAPVAESNKSN